MFAHRGLLFVKNQSRISSKANKNRGFEAYRSGSTHDQAFYYCSYSEADPPVAGRLAGASVKRDREAVRDNTMTDSPT